MNKRVLYISYDGMTDPLGQSQVLPYLIELSKKGYQFTLLSAEKPDRYLKYADVIDEIAKENNIDWETIPFTKSPPIISKILDLKALKKKAGELHNEKNFDLIHCRSYVSADVGLELHNRTGVPYLFDMRGFWVDERVDGGIWNLSNPVYRFAYWYYKRKERKFIENADHLISLTEAGRKELKTWKYVKDQNITVIPCAADFDLFRPLNKEEKQEVRRELGFSESDLIISYLGSIGTWYLIDEMLDFMKNAKASYPESRFLFLTPEPEELILGKAQAKGMDPNDFIIRFSKREEVNYHMNASDLSVFFIKPCFSKISSSPTKQGEILAMGIPVITNKGVGDVESIIQEQKNGIIISDFSPASYQKAIAEIPALLSLKADSVRNSQIDYYDLKNGAERYLNVYQQILS